jgi:hypothetical protein
MRKIDIIYIDDKTETVEVVGLKKEDNFLLMNLGDDREKGVNLLTVKSFEIYPS